MTGRIIIRSASGRLFLDCLSEWIIFAQPYDYSLDVNRLFSCFAESIEAYGETLKAFIFSLKNSEGLPPFKCMAQDKSKAIYKSSLHGPSFGEGPTFGIGYPKEESLAQIGTPYSAPREVNNKDKVLAGPLHYGYFTPDNYEVFYLD